MRTNLSYFIFGAATYQIFFIFFQKIFINENERELSRKEVREKISCKSRKSRRKREIDVDYSFPATNVKEFLQYLTTADNPDYKKPYVTSPLYEQDSCSCGQLSELYGKSLDFSEIFKNEEENEIRKKQYDDFLERNYFQQMALPMIKRAAFNPIEVPLFGMQIDPLKMVTLPVKIHLPLEEKIKIDFKCSFCDFGAVVNNYFSERL